MTLDLRPKWLALVLGDSTLESLIPSVNSHKDTTTSVGAGSP
jgi:hypothetical protein